jgi:hypothetical protein
MSESVTFTSCVLQSFNRNHKRGQARFSCNLTIPLAQKMGWADAQGKIAIPEIMTGGDVEGSLAGTSMTLQSSEGALAQYQIEFKITTVGTFELKRRELEKSRGKGFRFELHFTVEFPDMTGCRYLEEYMVSVGDQKGTLLVRYEPAAKQQTLPGAGDAELTQMVEEIKTRTKREDDNKVK